ncbi:hypothetical protein ACWC3X_40085 [Streptomyces populi]
MVRTRALDRTSVFLYAYLDARYCKARVNHRIASQAVVTTGITKHGGAKYLGRRRATVRPKCSEASSCACCADAA